MMRMNRREEMKEKDEEEDEDDDLVDHPWVVFPAAAALVYSQTQS